MLIYLATNLINGKLYVGQSIQPLKKRINQHFKEAKCEKDNMPFHHAIRKYGNENFKWETIEFIDNIDKLDERETFWILHYKSNDSKIGYNISLPLESPKRRYNLKFTNKIKNKYIGVTINKKSNNKKFQSSIIFQGELFCKCFINEIEAAKCYDKLAIYFLGKDYKLINFQNEKYTDEELKENYNLIINKRKKYKGLCKRNGNKWGVHMGYNGKYVITKNFNNEIDAANAYDKISLYLRGNKYFKLNFPENENKFTYEELKSFYDKTVCKKRNKISKYEGVFYVKKREMWQSRYKGKYICSSISEDKALEKLNNYKKENNICQIV